MAPASAQTNRQFTNYNFDLPAQALADSLRAVGSKASVNVVFEPSAVQDKGAPVLQGEYSVQEALNRLLDGSGLAVRVTQGGSFVIESPRASDARETASEQLRLAQVPPEPQVRGAAATPKENQSQEVVVTGTQIRGVQNSTAPVIVLDRKYIESTGLSTTEKLLESLPQNFSRPNSQFGKRIDLRGIGPGTTLTLLNGRRMPLDNSSGAAEISALPLSAIERVEILTDGASALYGADAVGGVVNFILKRDYEGAQTRMHGGWADGVSEHGASQIIGTAWESGQALISADYYHSDLLAARDRRFFPATSQLTSLAPREEQSSFMFHLEQKLNDSFSTFADALYTKRNIYSTGRLNANQDFRVDTPSLMSTLGLDWQLTADWALELSGSYAESRAETVRNAVPSPAKTLDPFETWSGRIKADGSVFTIGGGAVRAAIGADWRSEDFSYGTTFSPARFDHSGRTVRSIFGELYVPLIGSSNAIPGIHALDISIAGRYDDYSDIGSSVDPRFGVAWAPIARLKVRGSYGTSYVPPKLIFFNPANAGGYAFTDLDLGLGGASSTQMLIYGPDLQGVKPQTSENTSFGADYIFENIGLKLGLNYYRIVYSDKIGSAGLDNRKILADGAGYASVILRNPSLAQIDQYIALAQAGGAPFIGYNPDFTTVNFDRSTIDVIIDSRDRNLSVLKTSGWDVTMQYALHAGEGELSLGLAGTYITQLEQQLTPATPAIELVDTVGNPPHWRARGAVGYQRGGWTANIFVNHKDAYEQPGLATPVTISSYTTVDANLAYDFGSRSTRAFLQGLKLSLSAQNTFDKDPPRTAPSAAVSDDGFDAANANPLGRLIVLEIQKSW